MVQRLYVAVIDREPGEENWSILVPDFPEIASVAERMEDWGGQALDAIRTALDARRQDGEAIPDMTPLPDIVRDWPVPWRAYPVLVAVEVAPPTQPVRLNISMEEDLLKRVDTTAERRGMTRSAFLAEGARRLLHEDSTRHARTSARSG